MSFCFSLSLSFTTLRAPFFSSFFAFSSSLSAAEIAGPSSLMISTTYFFFAACSRYLNLRFRRNFWAMEATHSEIRVVAAA